MISATPANPIRGGTKTKAMIGHLHREAGVSKLEEPPQGLQDPTGNSERQGHVPKCKQKSPNIKPPGSSPEKGFSSTSSPKPITQLNGTNQRQDLEEDPISIRFPPRQTFPTKTTIRKPGAKTAEDTQSMTA